MPFGERRVVTDREYVPELHSERADALVGRDGERPLQREGISRCRHAGAVPVKAVVVTQQ